MKIEKYTKLKNGQYKLNFDNDTEVLLHEDLILKSNLLIKKKLTEEELGDLLEKNSIYLVYDQAIKYLKTKMRSKKEISLYLSKKGIAKEQINEAIILLVNQGYLNDDIYCKAFINDKINLSNDGPNKIKESLKTNGISDDIINKNLEIFNIELEIERINKLIDKQIKANHNKSQKTLKVKIINNLISLGYRQSLVMDITQNIRLDDKEISQKEYQKLYNKLSKKYQGQELEYKIRQKMYQKGFKNSSDY